jgi:hypothetical protein
MILPMNVDEMLRGLNAKEVNYLLIGGMNFMVRHLPELTFDVDIWVHDKPRNLERLNAALRQLGAAWGPDKASWRPVTDEWRWLESQGVFCLTTDHGALDVFRDVVGLEGRYDECQRAASSERTAAGIPFLSLSDEHRLACQEALPPASRNHKRMEVLRRAIERKKSAA